MTAARAASSAPASKGKAGKGLPPKSSDETTGPWRPAIPMKPRKGLFVALMLVLAVWCGVMVWMYVRAIHPALNPPSQPPRTTEPAVAAQQTP
jgi:hypothetical protein